MIGHSSTVYRFFLIVSIVFGFKKKFQQLTGFENISQIYDHRPSSEPIAFR